VTGGNWWRAATVVGVAGWLGWRANPYYYDYYPSDDGYYWGYSDTYGTTAGSTIAPQTYAQQTQAIDTGAQQQENGDWMPLGVFAISKEGESVAAPNMYVQLALNKEGAIAGTFYNATTDQSHEVEGIVDKNSQRVVWKGVDNDNSPVVETGIYNLTQSEAPAQVYFTDGRIENIMLVRVDES
jgi:hypothetical protein